MVLEKLAFAGFFNTRKNQIKKKTTTGLSDIRKTIPKRSS